MISIKSLNGLPLNWLLSSLLLISYTLFSWIQEECKRRSGDSCWEEIFVDDDAVDSSILKQTPIDVIVWSTASGGHLSLACEKWLILIPFTISSITLFLLFLFSSSSCCCSCAYISTSPSNSSPLYTTDLYIFFHKPPQKNFQSLLQSLKLLIRSPSKIIDSHERKSLYDLNPISLKLQQEKGLEGN